MKICYFKKRAKRPDFSLTKIGATTFVNLKSTAAMARFFETSREEDDRASEFFGIDGYDAQRKAG